VVYAGASSNFTLVSNGPTITVTDNTGAEGVDTVTSAERLRFNGVDHAVVNGTTLANTINGGAGARIAALAGVAAAGGESAKTANLDSPTISQPLADLAEKQVDDTFDFITRHSRVFCFQFFDQFRSDHGICLHCEPRSSGLGSISPSSSKRWQKNRSVSMPF
jgi:hypothetical protein